MMARSVIFGLIDFALRFLFALAFVAGAWSLSEIVRSPSKQPIPALRGIAPSAPCAPDRSGVMRLARIDEVTR